MLYKKFKYHYRTYHFYFDENSLQKLGITVVAVGLVAIGVNPIAALATLAVLLLINHDRLVDFTDRLDTDIEMSDEDLEEMTREAMAQGYSVNSQHRNHNHDDDNNNDDGMYPVGKNCAACGQPIRAQVN